MLREQLEDLFAEYMQVCGQTLSNPELEGVQKFFEGVTSIEEASNEELIQGIAYMDKALNL